MTSTGDQEKSNSEGDRGGEREVEKTGRTKRIAVGQGEKHMDIKIGTNISFKNEKSSFTRPHAKKRCLICEQISLLNGMFSMKLLIHFFFFLNYFF